ncbi:serine hydrolase domain-containing protein [Hymenobacter sediminicola]|uniref:Beta-lactamase family protein n=1 Tax=Hymenobacter sediminicola TaxID=2761579 RepID=A0A7G7W403_9BACT|nr:serine hydrolase domain-containing protein [Hymenobacter sediminicola]QNH61096.1 beta-lactamase family protein [Hymenobacter sediminicola]
MRYALFLLASAAGMLLIDGCTTSHAQVPASSQPVLTDNPLRTALDSAVHRVVLPYMQQPEAAGLSIGVYQQGRQRFYNYGEVEKGTGRRPTATTYYDMGSVSKTFVGTLLAQAVIDKKVQLTDDIRQYLPGQYPNLEYQGRPVRLVDLSNHTSGLPGTAHVYTAATKQRLDQLNLAEKTAHYNRYSADSLLADMHRFQLVTEPGTTYRYNGVATLVLQLLLERIYQQPYEQLVTGYVRKQFGLHDTKRVLSTKEQTRYAIGYTRPYLPQAHLNYTGYWGGPNLSSTAADLLRYAQANLQERLPAVRLAHQRTWGSTPESGMGLCWMLDTDAQGNKRVYHNGKSTGYNTRLVLYPDTQVAMVLLVNENSSQDRLTALEESLKRLLPRP